MTAQFVLIFSGESANTHSAMHECTDVCRGYGCKVRVIEDKYPPETEIITDGMEDETTAINEYGRDDE